MYVPTTSNGSAVVGGIGANPIDLLRHEGNDAEWSDGFRPVDVSFDDCGRLLVSSDGSGGNGSKVVRIERIVEVEVPTISPTSSPTKVPSSEPTRPTFTELLRNFFTSILEFFLSFLRK